MWMVLSKRVGRKRNCWRKGRCDGGSPPTLSRVAPNVPYVRSVGTILTERNIWGGDFIVDPPSSQPMADGKTRSFIAACRTVPGHILFSLPPSTRIHREDVPSAQKFEN